MQAQIVSKIKRLRQEKGLTQPQMAEKLNIDKSAYARLESGETYSSWAKYFEELLTIFEITPEKFFEGIESNVVINNNQRSYSGNANVENLYADNKELYEKLLCSQRRTNCAAEKFAGKEMRKNTTYFTETLSYYFALIFTVLPHPFQFFRLFLHQCPVFSYLPADNADSVIILEPFFPVGKGFFHRFVPAS